VSERPRGVEMATLWKLQNGFHKGLGHRAHHARCPHSHKPIIINTVRKEPDLMTRLDTTPSTEAR
jgi:hypothetical protein